MSLNRIKHYWSVYVKFSKIKCQAVNLISLDKNKRKTKILNKKNNIKTLCQVHKFESLKNSTQKNWRNCNGAYIKCKSKTKQGKIIFFFR